MGALCFSWMKSAYAAAEGSRDARARKRAYAFSSKISLTTATNRVANFLRCSSAHSRCLRLHIRSFVRDRVLASTQHRHHSIADSARINATRTTNIAVTAASSRSLKTRRETSHALAGTAPDANPAACARNPMRGFKLNTLCHEAANVTATSHANGASVTHENRARADLMMMVVATQSATIASNWFAIPKSGHSELIPPSGSRTPCQRKAPQAPTVRPLVIRMLG